MEGVTLVGCTLWSLIRLSERGAVQGGLDRKYERSLVQWRPGMRRPYLLTVEAINARHRRQAGWLERALRSQGGPTIVVTHHLPSYSLIQPAFLESKVNSAFASHCDSLIGSPAVAWICGHSHTRLRRLINGVPVVINPRGYPWESTGFDPSLTLG